MVGKTLKKVIIAVIVILAILGICAVVFFIPYLQTAPNAIIEVKKGTVEIYSGSGWNKASSGTELKQGNYVRTLSDGEANIIFSGNSVARLSNNTRVKIVELKVVDKLLQVRLNQSRGEVWHSISPVSGISSYIIETPFGNFTEVGTSFGTSVGKKKVAVLNGFVFQLENTQVIIPNGAMARFLAGEPPRIAPLYEDTWVQQNKKADDDWLVKRREEIKKKYSLQISMAKSLGPKVLNTEITDDKISDGIDRYLHGEINVPKLIEDGKVPEQALPMIPDEFLLTPSGKDQSVLDDLYRHAKIGPQSSQQVPFRYYHAEDGPDKSKYVPPDYKPIKSPEWMPEKFIVVSNKEIAKILIEKNELSEKEKMRLIWSCEDRICIGVWEDVVKSMDAKTLPPPRQVWLTLSWKGQKIDGKYIDDILPPSSVSQEEYDKFIERVFAPPSSPEPTPETTPSLFITPEPTEDLFPPVGGIGDTPPPEDFDLFPPVGDIR